jgi:hypothetical protein
LNSFSPSAFESLVKTVFLNAGFEVISRNKFDKKGGDADLVLTRSIPLISDFADDFSLKVYVQIKKKRDIDHGDVAGVEQLIRISENDNNAMKILLSSASCFTEKCRALAKENKVILINGNQFMTMAVRYL